MIKLVLFAGVLISIVGLSAVVRVKPLSPEVWAVDPAEVSAPSYSGHVLLAGDQAVILDMPVAELSEKLEAIILATPRTSKLSGDLANGPASYVTRSLVMGFPDVASVKVEQVSENQSRLHVFSRLVYGVADLGVNEARVQSWLDQL